MYLPEQSVAIVHLLQNACKTLHNKNKEISYTPRFIIRCLIYSGSDRKFNFICRMCFINLNSHKYLPPIMQKTTNCIKIAFINSKLSFPCLLSISILNKAFSLSKEIF